MIEKFKAIFFDAGGTLLYPHPSVGHIYSEVAARHGLQIGMEEINERFMMEWKKRDGLSKLTDQVDEKIEKKWWRELVWNVFSHLNPEDRFDPFFEELHDLFARPEVWRLYPETLEVLKRLRQKGVRLCVVSNWDSRLFKLCEGLAIQKYFDFILASAVFGASKPGAKIFEEALRRMSLRPDEVLHIGDSYEDDIKGAASVGIQTALVDRHHHFSFDSTWRVRPNYVIRDLKALIE